MDTHRRTVPGTHICRTRGEYTPVQHVPRGTIRAPIEEAIAALLAENVCAIAVVAIYTVEGMPDRIAATQAFQQNWIGPLSSERFSGILAANDVTAIGVLQAARAAGQEAGKDFALIGFDDLPAACIGGLTSVRPPLEEMGEEAGRLLLRRLQGDYTSLQVRLRSLVVPRASTPPLAGVFPVDLLKTH